MKSPEDYLDDRLRDALKRRFDDFEVKPEPSLKSNIFTELLSWQKEKRFQRNWVISLSLAILFTGVLFYNSGGFSSGKVAAASPGTRPKNAKSVANASRPAATTSGFKTVARVQNTSAPQVVAAAHTDISSVSSASRHIPAGSQTLRNSQNTSVSPAPKQPALPDTNPETGPAAQPVKEPEAGEEQQLNLGEIELMAGIPARFDAASLPLNDTIYFQSGAASGRNARKRGWSLLVGVTPVKTFQILNVISNPDLMYRNFQFPGSASVETLGYKLSGGLEKNGFQVVLSYGHYRQSVRYEMAGNEFEVVGNGSDATVKRKFRSIHSEQTLRLAGLGVRKQFVPKLPAIRDFYAVGGLDFTREMSKGKNMIWANAGIGRQVAVGRNTSLQIGPYVEYGFTRLRNAEGAFQVQPYQVGLSIILKNRLMR